MWEIFQEAMFVGERTERHNEPYPEGFALQRTHHRSRLTQEGTTSVAPLTINTIYHVVKR